MLPSRRMPPSAISGIASPIARRHRTSASTCGMPKFVVNRVEQPPPGPMPTLMRVDAAIEQKPRALGRRDVAGDQLDVAALLAQLFDRALHHRGVPVRDVDDEHVGARAQHLRGALEVVAGRADRGADAQPALARRASRRDAAGA